MVIFNLIAGGVPKPLFGERFAALLPDRRVADEKLKATPVLRHDVAEATGLVHQAQISRVTAPKDRVDVALDEQVIEDIRPISRRLPIDHVIVLRPAIENRLVHRNAGRIVKDRSLLGAESVYQAKKVRNILRLPRSPSFVRVGRPRINDDKRRMLDVERDAGWFSHIVLFR